VHVEVTVTVVTPKLASIGVGWWLVAVTVIRAAVTVTVPVAPAAVRNCRAAVAARAGSRRSTPLVR